MNELERLQEWMAPLLRRRGALPEDPRFVEEAHRYVRGNGRLSPAEQLEVYREQFWLRHTASLLSDFPGLSRLIGQSAWERLVEEYLERDAPSSWSLRDLGREVPRHVRESKWLPHHGVAVDMARLEWAYVELFDAADAPALDGARLAAILPEEWERARVVLAPAVLLLRMDHAVAELRARLCDASEPVAVPGPDPRNLVVYRGRSRDLHHAVVTDVAFALLAGLCDGLPLLPACRRAAESVPEGARELEAEIGGWFLDWGKRGWVTDVDAS